MSQNILARFAARIFDRPLLIAPRPLEAYLRMLGGRLGIPAGIEFSTPIRGADMADFTPTQARPIESKSYSVAIVPIMGPLVQRAGMIDANCTELSSYEDVGSQVRAALADPKISGILLHVDSPGGEVAGAFDLAALLAGARAEKPIVAFVEDLALSAGYLLASCADEIVATQTGYVGSVGVITTHVDLSGALAKEGIVVTHIHAGARKADGSPYMSLSKEARAELDGFIDRDYGLFVDRVAASRVGHLTPAAIRATEAAVFTAQDGVANGLADHIGTRELALQRLAALIGEREQSAKNGSGISAVSEAPVVGAAANHEQEGIPMGDLKKDGGEVIDLASENAKLKADLAKANAIAEVNAKSLAAVKAQAKLTVIEKYQAGDNAGDNAGRKVTVTGTNLEAVAKMAEFMEAEELEKHLAALPVVTHAKAQGVADSKPKADDSLRKIAGQLGMTPAQVETFSSVRSIHLDGTVTLANGDRVLASSINAGRA